MAGNDTAYTPNCSSVSGNGSPDVEKFQVQKDRIPACSRTLEIS